MTEPTSSIKSRYGAANLTDRILSALREAGHATDPLTAETLNLVDQLHAGGFNSTVAQAEMAGVTGEMRVLDAGCGVCGSSRYLVSTFGCRIDAIDLTPDYVETAVQLNALCGLDGAISVREGSVTDLDFPDGSFDLVWCQNVSMNVMDKPRMFAEAYRVLVPGGKYTLSHAAKGPAGEPYYPLPWARDASYSFIETPEEMVALLTRAGFVNIETRQEKGTPGSSRTLPKGALGSAVVMGSEVLEQQANGVRSGQDGRLIGLLIVAERPR